MDVRNGPVCNPVSYVCVVGTPSATTQSRGRGGLDLLGDLGGDPFAGPTSNTAARKEVNLLVFTSIGYIFLRRFIFTIFLCFQPPLVVDLQILLTLVAMWLRPHSRIQRSHSHSQVKRVYKNTGY